MRTFVGKNLQNSPRISHTQNFTASNQAFHQASNTSVQNLIQLNSDLKSNLGSENSQFLHNLQNLNTNTKLINSNLYETSQQFSSSFKNSINQLNQNIEEVKTQINENLKDSVLLALQNHQEQMSQISSENTKLETDLYSHILNLIDKLNNNNSNNQNTLLSNIKKLDSLQLQNLQSSENLVQNLEQSGKHYEEEASNCEIAVDSYHGEKEKLKEDILKDDMLKDGYEKDFVRSRVGGF